MTTETLEQVAEATQAEAAEQPESTQVGEQPEGEASEPDLSSLLKEMGEDVGEPGTEAEKPEAAPPEVQERVEKALQAERAKLQSEETAKQRQAEQEGIRRVFQARRGTIEGYLLNLGLSPEQAQAVSHEFDIHHGQSQVVWQATFLDGLKQASLETLPETERQAFAERFPKLASNKHFLEAYVETTIKAKGLLTPKQAKEQSDARIKAYTAKLYKEKRLAGTSQADTGKAAAIPTGGLSLEQINDMPTSEWLSLGDKAHRDKILADAHRRAGR